MCRVRVATPSPHPRRRGSARLGGAQRSRGTRRVASSASCDISLFPATCALCCASSDILSELMNVSPFTAGYRAPDTA